MKEIEAWLARDEDVILFLYKDKPFKGSEQWHENPVSITGLIELRGGLFPEIKWSDDEPTRVTITIKSNMENDKGNTTKCANANMEID